MIFAPHHNNQIHAIWSDGFSTSFQLPLAVTNSFLQEILPPWSFSKQLHMQDLAQDIQSSQICPVQDFIKNVTDQTYCQ